MSKYFYRFIWIFEALIAPQRVWPNHNTINTTVKRKNIFYEILKKKMSNIGCIFYI